MENQKRLNVYGQEIWHDEVVVVGTEESLRSLHTIIGEVLEKGRSKGEFTASDGDKYDLVVKMLKGTDTGWEELELPYREMMAQDKDKKKSKNDIQNE